MDSRTTPVRAQTTRAEAKAAKQAAPRKNRSQSAFRWKEEVFHVDGRPVRLCYHSDGSWYVRSLGAPFDLENGRQQRCAWVPEHMLCRDPKSAQRQFSAFMARTLTPVPDAEAVRAEYGEVLRAIAYRWRDLGWSESDKALLLRLYEFFPR